MRNQQLLKLKRSDVINAKKPVLTPAKKPKFNFASFCNGVPKFLSALFALAEILVLMSIYFVVLKYCFYTVFEDEKYIKIYGLIHFLKENYVGAILFFLLIFSRTFFKMLSSIRFIRAKDYEVRLNRQKQMWDVI